MNNLESIEPENNPSPQKKVTDLIPLYGLWDASGRIFYDRLSLPLSEKTNDYFYFMGIIFLNFVYINMGTSMIKNMYDYLK